ncbi:hypothetical protein CMI37_17165 [Candidatus Pacearchaeota archaeon]|nr:hypothetical protein [Candidatus Pacearchaeota archaeon]
MAEKVRALMIVEMAGRPAGHVVTTLENHVGQLKNFRDIEVFDIKVSAPKELEERKGFFTCFAEVEFEADNFARVADMIFDFMPSSIEILEPANMKFNANDATGLLNTLSGRLHRYDEIAKIANLQNQQLLKKLQAFEGGVGGGSGAEAGGEKVEEKAVEKKEKKKERKKK